MMVNNSNLDFVHIDVYLKVGQNLVKFCPFLLKILSRNEILASIKDHNSFTNLQKMILTVNNHNLALVNINLYRIWSHSVHLFS